MHAYHDVAAAVFKRAVLQDGNNPHAPGGNTDSYELPTWTPLLVLLNLIVFLPAWLIVHYTIGMIFPVLAIIEDENPPAYEPVSLNDDDAASVAEDPANGTPRPAGATLPFGGSHTVTSSLRSCHRILRANGGFRANFRGLFCLLAQNLLTTVLVAIFSSSLGVAFVPVATLLASLCLVQLSAAWVHIVISQQSPLRFWRRLPPFKRTFDATWKAVTVYWAAEEFTRLMPYLVGRLLGLRVSNYDEELMTWKTPLVAILMLLSSIFVLIPANVVLIRVQASFLPEDQTSIIPFDRSFEGKVEPAVVGGKGFVSMTDAWATFSRSAWRRLVKLYVKVYVVSLGLAFLTVALIAPQVYLVVSSSEKVRGGN